MWQFFESMFSKLGEWIGDQALNNVNSIKDFELTWKTLQRNLKSLQAKASDVKDEIKKTELSGQKKRKRDVEDWLEGVEFIEKEVAELESEVESEGFISRFMFGGKASQLNEQVCKLVEQTPQCGELVVDVCKGMTLLTNRMVGEAFEKNLERIWSLLETGGLSCIGVHGMGGAGKTTLAKHIHNRLLKQSQVHVFWITVSQDFTIKSLQNNIARFLGVDLLDDDGEDIRAARLYTALSHHKSSVLILDDVWEKIDLLKLGCPFSIECCRMIITTRSLEVCHQIGCQEVVAMQKLEEDEAWKLFSETLTLSKEIKLGSQVEEIAKSVANLCDGLPLGIVVLAGSMRGVTSIHKWANVLAELKESVVGNDGMGKVEIFEVLKYSFNRLNDNEQLCFLYCSLYPEDYEIGREKLVNNFISEGLMNERTSRRAQVGKGHIMLDKLVNVCLLQICSSDYLLPEHVKMHDLIRDMALVIKKDKYMVRAGVWPLKEIPIEEEWTKDLEKVSLMKNGIRRIEEGISPDCPNLSTLLFQGNFQLEFIPGSFFSKMQGLCTLNLCYTDISMLPDSISDLTSLKALLLNHCSWLKYVPNLGKLRALRELDLEESYVKELPEGLEELHNLVFLSLFSQMSVLNLKVLPRGLLVKLDRLQCLRLPYHVEVAKEEIESLKRLEQFWGKMKNVGDFNSFITTSRSRGHDTFYRIQVGVLGHDLSLLGGEQVCCGNKVLMLSECNLEDERVLGHDLDGLAISNCEGVSKCLLDGFSRLNNPTSLKTLSVATCGGIESILRSEQELAALKFLHLAELDDLKGVIEKGEIGPSTAPTQVVFSSLKRLSISFCNKMRSLGLQVSGLPNIEEIHIQCCEEMEEVFEDEGRVSLTLPRLRKLLFNQLPKLKSVCKAATICNSIQQISIRKCPGLMKQLPVHLDVPLPTTLGRIKVDDREWWESLEWDNPNLPTLLQPFLLIQ